MRKAQFRLLFKALVSGGIVQNNYDVLKQTLSYLCYFFITLMCILNRRYHLPDPVPPFTVSLSRLANL